MKKDHILHPRAYIRRLKSKTPPFWLQMRKFNAALSIGSATLITTAAQVGFELSDTTTKILKLILIVTATVTAMSFLPTSDTSAGDGKA